VRITSERFRPLEVRVASKWHSLSLVRWTLLFERLFLTKEPSFGSLDSHKSPKPYGKDDQCEMQLVSVERTESIEEPRCRVEKTCPPAEVDER
jgi:hypothetical protein